MSRPCDLRPLPWRDLEGLVAYWRHLAACGHPAYSRAAHDAALAALCELLDDLIVAAARRRAELTPPAIPEGDVPPGKVAGHLPEQWRTGA